MGNSRSKAKRRQLQAQNEASDIFGFDASTRFAATIQGLRLDTVAIDFLETWVMATSAQVRRKLCLNCV